VQEPALVNVGNAHTCCVTQGTQARLFVAVAALDESQAVSQHLAGVLVPAGGDELVYEFKLAIGENHILRRHGETLWQSLVLAHYANPGVSARRNRQAYRGLLVHGRHAAPAVRA
jgi:hypothetical protein